MANSPSMNLVDQIAKAWPVNAWRQFNVVVAVSGGADSVALLKSLCLIREQTKSKQAASSLVATHYNHCLRGKDSDRDEAFVRNLAGELGVDFFSAKAQGGASSEEQLRDERYQFFKKHCPRNEQPIHCDRTPPERPG